MTRFLALLLFSALAVTASAKKPEVYGPEPTMANVSYGPNERHVLDFWKAESDKPTPVAFYIHGGAWRGRDKIDARAWLDIQSLLDADISVVTISYRLLKHAEEVEPFVKAPMEDSARALQFVRSKAEEWNLDKERIGVAGVSAGGCTALWLAYHDDMADPDSADPVERESTRVHCVAVGQAQTSLDPEEVREWMPLAEYGAHAFNKKTLDEVIAEGDKVKPWIAKYSPAALLSKDDPPTMLSYGREAPFPDPRKGGFLLCHSAAYGVGLQQRCEELGVSCKLVYGKKKGGEPFALLSDFLIEALKQ
ncbi:MAG: alpha/beta hydrolase [Akkermansiaceae bacterium]|nr:alpha/beta hydrolase [Akkermansiaceae bacterium]